MARKKQFSVRLPEPLLERLARYAVWLGQQTQMDVRRTDVLIKLLRERLDAHEREHGPLPQLEAGEAPREL